MIIHARKKPQDVRAIQWNGENSNEVVAFLGAYAQSVQAYEITKFDVFIHYKDGRMTVHNGEYLVATDKEELLMYSAENFEYSYERIE